MYVGEKVYRNSFRILKIKKALSNTNLKFQWCFGTIFYWIKQRGIFALFLFYSLFLDVNIADFCFLLSLFISFWAMATFLRISKPQLTSTVQLGEEFLGTYSWLYFNAVRHAETFEGRQCIISSLFCSPFWIS